jgi:hypothetical protein
MSQPGDTERCEVHLFSPIPTESHVELLTVLVHYHRTGARLGWEHSVNFGRPWLPGSECRYGLVSLPYLDGPILGELKLPETKETVWFLWLIPITEQEREYKKAYGMEALERRFEESSFDYLDPKRRSVV